jgi:hypothetical protein
MRLDTAWIPFSREKRLAIGKRVYEMRHQDGMAWCNIDGTFGRSARHLRRYMREYERSLSPLSDLSAMSARQGATESADQSSNERTAD